jgi:sugar/nucleoside kinase (ribokinase family)
MSYSIMPKKLPVDISPTSGKTRNTPDLAIFGQVTIDDIYYEGRGLISLATPGGDSIYSVLGATVWPLSVGAVACIGLDYPRDKLHTATCNPDQTDWSGLSLYESPSIHDKATFYNDGRRVYEFEDASLIHLLSPGVLDIPAHMDTCTQVHLAPFNCQRQLEVVRYFKNKGAQVTLDVECHFILADQEKVLEMLRLDPIFVPSLEHIQLLSGSPSCDPLVQWEWIKQCGVKLAVIKCGGEGCWIFDVPGKKLWKVGVVPNLSLVDLTGAGDSFCGGFIAGLIRTRDPLQAAAYGAVSASFIVESLGAICPAHYTPALAQARLAAFQKTLPKQPILLP